MPRKNTSLGKFLTQHQNLLVLFVVTIAVIAMILAASGSIPLPFFLRTAALLHTGTVPTSQPFPTPTPDNCHLPESWPGVPPRCLNLCRNTACTACDPKDYLCVDAAEDWFFKCLDACKGRGPFPKYPIPNLPVPPHPIPR